MLNKFIVFSLDAPPLPRWGFTHGGRAGSNSGLSLSLSLPLSPLSISLSSLSLSLSQDLQLDCSGWSVMGFLAPSRKLSWLSCSAHNRGCEDLVKDALVSGREADCIRLAHRGETSH